MFGVRGLLCIIFYLLFLITVFSFSLFIQSMSAANNARDLPLLFTLVGGGLLYVCMHYIHTPKTWSRKIQFYFVEVSGQCDLMCNCRIISICQCVSRASVPNNLSTVNTVHHPLAPLVPNLNSCCPGFAEVHVFIHNHTIHTRLAPQWPLLAGGRTRTHKHTKTHNFAVTQSVVKKSRWFTWPFPSVLYFFKRQLLKQNLHSYIM